MALGYGKLASRVVKDAFDHSNFEMAGYRTRLLLSPLGQTLLMRWLIASVIYIFRWEWFQILLWRWLQPVVILTAWIFVLNWARRMK